MCSKPNYSTNKSLNLQLWTQNYMKMGKQTFPIVNYQREFVFRSCNNNLSFWNKFLQPTFVAKGEETMEQFSFKEKN